MFNEIVRKYSTASSRDVIGCEDCKKKICWSRSVLCLVNWPSVLLVKLPGLSTFRLSCWCRNKVVCDVQQVLAIEQWRFFFFFYVIEPAYPSDSLIVVGTVTH